MFQPPKGMRDFLPDQMRRRQWMLGQIRAVFERFGYGPMETPVVESWELLSAKGSGEAVKDEIYYLKDKGERELGLRFDLTVPAARVIANNPQLPKPFRRYQIGPVFRYDNPQAGRFREFLQCDVDVFGAKAMDAEAELLAVAVDALRALGFSEFTIRVNNRKVLNEILRSLGVPQQDWTKVFRSLDKLEKIGEAQVRKELVATLTDEQAGQLFAFIALQGKPETVLALANQKFESDGIQELKDLVERCRAAGIAEMLRIDFSLVRGLDYYTGPIFEIAAKSEKSVGSVAGGGRYDNLIEQYGGKPTPAVGISLGFERLYEILEPKLPAPPITALVAAVGKEPEPQAAAIKLAAELRQAGIATVTDLLGRDLKKQLGSANAQAIPFVVIVGAEELKKNRFTLRDMKTGKQEELSILELQKRLK